MNRDKSINQISEKGSFFVGYYTLPLDTQLRGKVQGKSLQSKNASVGMGVNVSVQTVHACV